MHSSTKDYEQGTTENPKWAAVDIFPHFSKQKVLQEQMASEQVDPEVQRNLSKTKTKSKTKLLLLLLKAFQAASRSSILHKMQAMIIINHPLHHMDIYSKRTFPKIFEEMSV